MAGYRSTFIRASRLLSSALPIEALIRLSGQNLVVPVYHLISNDAPLHVKHLYKVKDEKQFINDLEFLLKHYTPIDYPELKTIVDSGKKTTKKVFILTFDDGLREFHDVIAPVLLKKGVPAINFLNSDFIGNAGLFYRYKASVLIDVFMKDTTLLKKEEVKQWFSQQVSGKQKGIKDTLLSVDFLDKDKLDVLANLVGVDFKEYLLKNRPYMDVDEIRSLIRQGFHFGGHSCNHPEYRFIGLDEQLSQTKNSVSHVVNLFGLDYRIFAFPFTDYGVKKTFFDRLNLDISFGSAGMKLDPEPHHIQRIPFETAGLGAGEILRGEYLYYLLKGMFGKNRIKRS
jgi:peptidoglycan/xylan/chitin deacetylase (PgdA/CDA1 family)